MYYFLEECLCRFEDHKLIVAVRLWLLWPGNVHCKSVSAVHSDLITSLVFVARDISTLSQNTCNNSIKTIGRVQQYSVYSDCRNFTLNLRVHCCFFTLDTGLPAISQYSEGPATGHLNTGFSWFACVYKQMLRWFSRFQVATTCFSCIPPDLNLLVTNFIFCVHVK